jgi:hypothetical protein
MITPPVMTRSGTMALESSVLHPSAASELRDRDLQAHIRAEYDEMPGLNLTLPQAARLFNCDATTCTRALMRLIAEGVLSADEGVFVRRGARMRRRGRRMTG